MGRMEITLRGHDGVTSRIAFGPLAGMGELLDPAKTVIVTDRLIHRIHGESFPPCPVIEVERGEAAKTLVSLETLYGRFLDLGLGRDSTVLAVGGGSITDLAGFAASTWLRGIAFGFAPTTLLAMVDASVGGKNGVDFRGFKNLVGSFAQPRFVRIDIGFLATLSDTEFASGMAEVVKHAVIAGGAYFDLVRTAVSDSGGDAGRALRASTEMLERIVAGSVEIKAGVVARDERESGERRKLNLGHSVGHGIEAVTGLPHGHCVAAGLGTVCRLAARMGSLDGADCDRITRLLSACGLPASIGEVGALLAAGAAGGPSGGDSGGPASNAPSGRIHGRPGASRPRFSADGPELRGAIAAAIPTDKKVIGSDILLALPEAIGSVAIEALPLADLQAFVMEAR
jgi:3-dehydroquinate synthase